MVEAGGAIHLQVEVEGAIRLKVDAGGAIRLQGDTTRKVGPTLTPKGQSDLEMELQRGRAVNRRITIKAGKQIMAFKEGMVTPTNVTEIMRGRDPHKLLAGR